LVKPKCYQLIGVPGSGKSTWASKRPVDPNCRLISTDSYVNAYALWHNKTYTEVFEEYMPKAIELMISAIEDARSRNQDIIWDQTSTTVASRMKKFRMLPNYEHIAVMFKTPDNVELQRRLANRPGKIIPEDVLSNMIANFEVPSLSEGFSMVLSVDN